MRFPVPLTPALTFLLACGTAFSPPVRATPASETRLRPAPERAAPPAAAPVVSYGALPLRFEENRGQSASPARFLARGSGYALALSPTETTLAVGGDDAGALRMRLVGANARANLAGLDPQPGASNYLIGNDPARWRTNVPGYARVAQRDVYPGVDLVYYGTQGQLEYDFVLAPGADPHRIRLAFDAPASIDAGGDLLVEVAGRTVRQQRPALYQQIEGARRAVAGRYVRRGQAVGFEVGAYDRRHPLVIDPVITLSYSTYIHGDTAVGEDGINDTGFSLAVDGRGAAYIAGITTSLDFPSHTPAQTNYGGGPSDAFVLKLNPDGTGIEYSTYLGGLSTDRGIAIAIDSSGNAYVTGLTGSSDFPVLGAFQPQIGGDGTAFDAFVTKLAPTGDRIVYSTYLGGSASEQARSIAVDALGSAYVAGFTASTDFPTRKPLQAANGGGSQDAFLVKFAPNGKKLLYGTYLGGDGNDGAFALAIDSNLNAYLAGQTDATNFPTANPLQAVRAGEVDGFVAKVNAAGSALVYSTYLGGTALDRAFSIAVDISGAAHVTGNTRSDNFPLANALQSVFQGGQGPPPLTSFRGDAFVAKLTPAGNTFAFSTYLSGAGVDQGNCIAVDSVGDIYVLGFTSSSNFDTESPLQPSLAAGYDGSRLGAGVDAFVVKLAASGARLLYATFLGGDNDDIIAGGTGLRVDFSGNAYVTGQTFSKDFPTAPVPGAFQPDAPPSVDDGSAFVAKIVDFYSLQFDAPDLTSSTPNPPPRFLVANRVGDAPPEQTALRPTPATPGNEVTCYNVYRSNTSNVAPTAGNLFTSVPPGQPIPSVPGGAFFVVTACYGDGAESGPSNVTTAGSGEPRLAVIAVDQKTINATGMMFTDTVRVRVNDIPFAAPATVTADNTMVRQKGRLANGQKLKALLAAIPDGGFFLIGFENSTGGIATIKVVKASSRGGARYVVSDEWVKTGNPEDFLEILGEGPDDDDIR